MKKQTSETKARYPWGAERPGVVEARAQLRIKQIPIEKQLYLEENQKEVERELKRFDDELQGAKDLLKTVAKHREKIKSRNRVSGMHLARLLGDHLGVSAAQAQEILKTEAQRISAGELPESAPRESAPRRTGRSAPRAPVELARTTRRKRSSR